MSLCKTAYYVFDIPQARRRVEQLRHALGETAAIAFAVKANPFLISGLAPWVDRLEICSPGESLLCDRQGVPPEKAVISGVYKTPAFIEELAAAGGDRIYTVESMNQFRLLLALAEKYRRPLKVLLRLTNGSQFGINREEIQHIIENRSSCPMLDILGIQFFSGTQKTSLKKLQREIRTLDGLLVRLEEDYGYRARELEYGPGLPVSYFREEPLEEEPLLAGLREALAGLSGSPAVTLELGRSIAAGCGTYCTHVVDRKCNQGQNYLMVDGGMHQMVYFGQYLGMKHPYVTVLGKEDAADRELWNVCGSLCSMNDILAKALPLPEIDLGDTLCFHRTGAYCVTEGMAMFLTRELPAVFLIAEDGVPRQARPSVETAPLFLPR